jgi:predicted transcriptional regulator
MLREAANDNIASQSELLFEELWSNQKMFQTNLILVLILLSLPVFPNSALAASGLIVSPAPYFRVGSGDDKVLTLDMIKGKVTAIFYENRKIVDANKRLKDELNKLYHEQTDALKDILVRLPIIDCSDAVWPFHGFWKRRLREHPRKNGTTIHCDWSGKVASAYGMKADVSNVVIIDKVGIIRSFTSGEVTADQIDDANKLLKVLVAEQILPIRGC